jgi:hypothetical protein
LSHIYVQGISGMGRLPGIVQFGAPRHLSRKRKRDFTVHGISPPHFWLIELHLSGNAQVAVDHTNTFGRANPMRPPDQPAKQQIRSKRTSVRLYSGMAFDSNDQTIVVCASNTRSHCPSNSEFVPCEEPPEDTVKKRCLTFA